MKIPHSLFTRRNFLNGLLGGWAAALAATFISPIVRFVFPPYREPDEVILPYADFRDMEAGAVKSFPWGSKPGALKKNRDGTHTAFVAVCTHLDCNVSWKADQQKFYCACHDGWYDAEGNNIAGPPPTPLRRLEVAIEEENLVIRKPGGKST